MSLFVDQLQICGFKSVSDPIEIPLDATLTLIVSPNGTGKTTICEAAELLLTGHLGTRRSANAAYLIARHPPEHGGCWVKGALNRAGEAISLRIDLAHQGVAVPGEPHLRRGTTQPRWSQLLADLVPAEAVAGIAGGTGAKNLRRLWLRSARFLYDHEVEHLVDDDRERRKLMADLLGIGGLQRRQDMATAWGEALERRLRQLEAASEDATRRAGDERRALDAIAPLDGHRLSQLRRDAGEIYEIHPVNLETLRERQQELEQQRILTRTRLARLKALRIEIAEARPVSQSEEEVRATRAALDEISEQLERSTSRRPGINLDREDVHALESWLDDAATMGVPEPAPFRAGLLAIAGEHTPQALQARRRHLHEAEELAARAAEARERAQEIARRAGVEPQVAEHEARHKEAQERLRLAERAFHDRAGPLERLTAAVRDMRPHLAHASNCPTCGHDWQAPAALARALSEAAGPMEAVLRELQTERDAASVAAREAEQQLQALRASHARWQVEQAALRELSGTVAEWETRRRELGLDPEQDEPDRALLQSGLRAVDREIDARDLLTELDHAAEAIGLSDLWRGGATRAQLHHTLASAREQLDREEETLLASITSLRERHERARAKLDHATAQARAARASLSYHQTVWRESLGAQGDLTPGALDRVQEILTEHLHDLTPQRELLAELAVALTREQERNRRSATLEQSKRELDTIARKTVRLGLALQSVGQDIHHLTERTSAAASEALAPLDASINAIFRRIQANPAIQRVDLDFTDPDLPLRVRLGEGTLHPREQLSRGQRQDLALSLFLARARALGGSFFLDEPFLHLDDLNRAATLDLLRTIAIQDAGHLRLVLTTSSASLARHLQQKLASVRSAVRPLRVIELKGGPVVGMRPTEHG